MNTVKILTIRPYQNIAATLKTLIQDSKEKNTFIFIKNTFSCSTLLEFNHMYPAIKLHEGHFIHCNFFKKLHFLKISRRIKENVISSVSIYISKYISKVLSV